MTQKRASSGLKNKKPGPRTFLLGALLILILAAAALFSMLNNTAPVDADSQEIITIQIAQGEKCQSDYCKAERGRYH